MKIGLLREEKIPADRRVVLTPNQCKRFKSIYSNIDLVVQSSRIRCFSDQEYIDQGIQVVDNVNDCDVLLGVKEVPLSFLLANKTYFYFSHTIKKQPYNRELLLKMIKMNITMIDYEVLRNHNGERLLGFGRYAGIVGAYNAFLTYGLKSKKYNLKPAYKCKNKYEMEGELKKIVLKNERIIITGNGRVGKGVIEIMNKSGIKKVSKVDFLNKKFDEPVFVHLDAMDYNERIDGSEKNKYDFYSYPELYKSSFLKYAQRADIFIAGHYYSAGSPYLFTRKDARSSDFSLKVIADISCDIDGPIASTIRSSMIVDPIYGYNPVTEQEVSFDDDNAIAVMAVSNLPCELPKDASRDFGENLLEKVFPALINGDEKQVVYNATICSNGDLNSNFEYLREYINNC